MSGRELETDSITRGGAQLKWHLSVPETVARIRTGSWNYVVLQDQSLQALERPEALHAAVKELASIIKSANAVPVLYMTWARQEKPEMQAAITEEYTLAARNNGCLLAPVGEAWKTALSSIDGLILHDKDQSHPNLTGSYIAACVIYSTITGNEAANLTGILPGDSALAALSDQPLLQRLRNLADRAIQEYGVSLEA